jgi:hypothetical protein
MTGEAADVVTYFRGAFSLIFGLALAEGFKQTVHDKAAQATDPVLYNEKIFSLLGFLFLILPFYQGTMRFYGHFYGAANSLPSNYSFIIMFDSFAFLIEAAIFFYMSRALSPVHWISFYIAVVALLWVDTLWGIATAGFHSTPAPTSWIILNLVWGAAALVMVLFNKHLSNERAVLIGCIGLFIRTVLDYALNWPFYFPSP